MVFVSKLITCLSSFLSVYQTTIITAAGTSALFQELNNIFSKPKGTSSLFATALGLLAAIPAVVAYNKFSNDSKKYSQKLENFSKRFLTIV